MYQLNSGANGASLPFTGMSPQAITQRLRVIDGGATDGGATDEVLLLEVWQASMRAENMSERTVEEWPAVIRRAARATAASTTRLEADALMYWLATFTAPRTRASYHAALVAWHTWLRRRGHREDDPMLQLRRPKVPRGVPHPCSSIGLGRILASPLSLPVRAMILLAAYQGLRVHEIAKIRGEQVDLDGDVLRVIGKGQVDAELPLHPDVAAIARAMPRRGWWFPLPSGGDRPRSSKSVSRTIGRTMRRLEVHGTAHSLRHWYATNLLRSGADIRVVQDLMRHATLSTTEGYLEVASGAGRAAVLRLPDVTALAGGRS